jgi:hypothetical protein
MRTPKLFPTVPRGVRRLFTLPATRDRILSETDEEVRVHLEMRVAELRAEGLDEAAAQAEALRLFGDSDEYRAYAERRAARKSRWQRVMNVLEAWTQDVHFANRQFRKHPGFTALALLTLALGIGANTAIFTVVHRLLIAPLPYPDGNRIVMLAMERDDHTRSSASVEALHAWEARAHSLASIGVVSVDGILVQDAEEADTVRAFITPSYLEVLGVHPVVGSRAHRGRCAAGRTTRRDDHVWIVAARICRAGRRRRRQAVERWHDVYDRRRDAAGDGNSNDRQPARQAARGDAQHLASGTAR